jgi:hypothetical protein
MIRRTFYKPDVHCAASGCCMIVGKGQMFCKDHYFALPKALRNDLWTAWRAAMNARRGSTSVEDQLRINREYQAAYQACTEYLRTAPRTPAAAMATVAYDAREYASKELSGGQPTEFRYVEGRML